MARKATVTEESILSAAFEMTREEGYVNVTARRLAAKAGCSTQPIFRLYKNMDELISGVYDRAIAFFNDYYASFPKTDTVPFVNLGMAYIQFAQEEKNIFSLLFLSESRGAKSMYELLNGSTGAVGVEVAMAREDGCADPSELFMKIWIFIHGAACMSITGDYDLTREETRELLIDSYYAYSGCER